MKPRIDIDICDYEGKTAELCDLSTFEPYEVYINNERVCTSERVEELEDENDELRELLCDLYEDQCDECDRWKYRHRMRELGVLDE